MNYRNIKRKKKKMNNFSTMIYFQVKPDKLAEFEALLTEMKREFVAAPGCGNFGTMKRFYTFDKVELGAPPRELTRIVKCVKYYSWAEFDSKENCGKAVGVLFEKYLKPFSKLLIAPFDINSGYGVG